MDVISVLERDHRKIESLLIRVRSASKKRQVSLLSYLENEWESHCAAEEEIIYPRFARTFGFREEAENSLEEHQAARDLLSHLHRLEAGTRQWDENVAELSELIRTHMQEEESLLFPELRRHLNTGNLEQWGEQTEGAKQSFLLAS
jgi:iron-sulfur cluster repair protein YtfE (RIC family)